MNVEGMLPRNRMKQEVIDAAIAKGCALQKKIELSLAFVDRTAQLLTLDESKTHDAEAAKCFGVKAEPAPNRNKAKKGIEGIGGLYVDLVPSTCWFSNIRSALSKNDWDSIRKKVYGNSNNRCDICKGFGNKHPVEAHERWGFDWDKKTQKLLKIESLCPACHQATHYGLAETRGFGEIAFERLSYVNGWSETQTDIHIKKAFDTWESRSEISAWKLDMSWLYDFIELDSETKKIIEDMKNGKVKRS